MMNHGSPTDLQEYSTSIDTKKMGIHGHTDVYWCDTLNKLGIANAR